jgi:GMP synthase (glutamine-hydrolysing)
MYMKPVLALQHVQDDHIGYLGHLLQEYGIAYQVVDVESDSLPDPTAYSAVIALGGSQHVYDEAAYPYFVQEKALICKAVEQHIPYLGLCLGAQLLANALGAQVKQHSMSELGFFDVQLTQEGCRDPLFAGLPGYQKVFHWHEDTFDLPLGAVLLAMSENTENQAFRYGACAYGLQYHIEVNPEMLTHWLHHPAFQQDIIDTLGIDAYDAILRAQSFHYPAFLKHARILFENFLRVGRLI